LEDKLSGLKYDMNEIKKVLEEVPIGEYLGRITREEFMQCLFD
jgi:lipoate-protein ligase A